MARITSMSHQTLAKLMFLQHPELQKRIQVHGFWAGEKRNCMVNKGNRVMKIKSLSVIKVIWKNRQWSSISSPVIFGGPAFSQIRELRRKQPA
jgi:hypothetical protein